MWIAARGTAVLELGPHHRTRHERQHYPASKITETARMVALISLRRVRKEEALPGGIPEG